MPSYSAVTVRLTIHLLLKMQETCNRPMCNFGDGRVMIAMIGHFTMKLNSYKV